MATCFIRKLPPTIVTSFRATLEELTEASVLVHVVDLTCHNAAEKSQVVEDILSELKLIEKPRITVLNKIDLDYPKNKLEVIVVSDESEDSTDEIVKSFSSAEISLGKACSPSPEMP